MVADKPFAFEFEQQLEEQERSRLRHLQARHEDRQTDGFSVSDEQAGSRVRRLSVTAFGNEPVCGEEDEASGLINRARPTAKRAKHTHQVVCRHWLRGMCIKGEFCDFLHIFDPTRMPPCRQYGKHGRCADYEQGTCPLRHEREDHLLAVGGSGFQDGLHSKGGATERATSSTVICVQYLFGYCHSGPHCAQRHLRLPPERRPSALLPDWYLQLVLANREELRVPALDGSSRRESAWAWRNLAEQVAADNQTCVEPPLDAGKTLESLLPANVFAPQSPPGTGESPRIRAFVIKSAKIENILTSVQRGIWATGKGNIEKFEEAFRDCHYVIYIMSANESGGFQGYARMASFQDPSLYPKIWGFFSAKLSANYRVQWLKQCKVDFEALASFTNPWNENKPLKKSRDGQELPLDLAEAICLRLDAAPDEDLLIGTPLANQPRIDHATFFTLSPEAQRQHEYASGLRQAPLLAHSKQTPFLSSQTCIPPPPPPPPPPTSERNSPIPCLDTEHPHT